MPVSKTAAELTQVKTRPNNQDQLLLAVVVSRTYNCWSWVDAPAVEMEGLREGSATTRDYVKRGESKKYGRLARVYPRYCPDVSGTRY